MKSYEDPSVALVVLLWLGSLVWLGASWAVWQVGYGVGGWGFIWTGLLYVQGPLPLILMAARYRRDGGRVLQLAERRRQRLRQRTAEVQSSNP